MRIRQVRREFWTDRRIALLPRSTRLFYIGLWAIADDAGFLRWELPQIAGELFPFESPKAREHAAERDGEILVREGRVILLDCGRHATIPTLERHQRTGGERLFTLRNEHKAEDSVALRETLSGYNRNVTERNGMEGNGEGTGGGSGALQVGAPRPLREIIGSFDDIVPRKGA